VGTRIHRPRPEEWRGAKTEEAMSTEYRIAEEHRRFSIQVSKNGKDWHELHPTPHIPRFFDTLQDARSWVATIKRGVVYHDAEDAPNLPVGERKAEDDTSDGIKPLEWFLARIGKSVLRTHNGICFPISVDSEEDAIRRYVNQKSIGNRYSDPR
jgi:hypothetical protein